MTEYCGRSETRGHGDYAVCGEPYYGEIEHQCGNCRARDLEAEVERLRAANREYGRWLRDKNPTFSQLKADKAELVLAIETHLDNFGDDGPKWLRDIIDKHKDQSDG